MRDWVGAETAQSELFSQVVCAFRVEAVVVAGVGGRPGEGFWVVRRAVGMLRFSEWGGLVIADRRILPLLGRGIVRGGLFGWIRPPVCGLPSVR